MSNNSDRRKEIEYISKSMKENHELRQVCLEVLSCIENLDDPLKILHCQQELKRVLFSPNDFLH